MKSNFDKAMEHLTKVIWLSHIPRKEWTSEDSLAFVEAQGFVREHGASADGLDARNPHTVTDPESSGSST